MPGSPDELTDCY